MFPAQGPGCLCDVSKKKSSGLFSTDQVWTVNHSSGFMLYVRATLFSSHNVLSWFRVSLFLIHDERLQPATIIRVLGMLAEHN